MNKKEEFMQFVRECVSEAWNTSDAAQDIMQESSPVECKTFLADISAEFPEIADIIKTEIAIYDDFRNGQIFVSDEQECLPFFIESLLSDTMQEVIDDFGEFPFYIDIKNNSVLFFFDDVVSFLEKSAKALDEYAIDDYVLKEKTITITMYHGEKYSFVFRGDENNG